MRLIVSELPDDGIRQEFKETIKVNAGGTDDNAEVSINVFRIGKKVLIEGSIDLSVTLNCSRCLNEYSAPMHITFREEYNPVKEIESDTDRELSDKDLDLGFYSDDEINVDEIVGEQVMLTVPMRPLCSSDCKGICPECGTDLNEKKCECVRDNRDPRLAPLNKLREAMKNRKE